MTRLEFIIEQAQDLSPFELEELLRVLSEQISAKNDESERGAAMRGLESLTESTRDEDWSPFYPPDLIIA